MSISEPHHPTHQGLPGTWSDPQATLPFRRNCDRIAQRSQGKRSSLRPRHGGCMPANVLRPPPNIRTSNHILQRAERQRIRVQNLLAGCRFFVFPRPPATVLLSRFPAGLLTSSQQRSSFWILNFGFGICPQLAARGALAAKEKNHVLVSQTGNAQSMS